MATHSSILAWRIPWKEKSGGLQSTGSQRVGPDRLLSLGQFQQLSCWVPAHSGSGGSCFHLPPSEPVAGRKEILFFPSLLILSSALAWSYCTYANEAMSAIEANSAIYSWSLATLITAAADFRKPKHTRVRARTHTHAHTHTHARTHAHTLHRVYFFPQDINFPSHCSLGRRMQH